MRFAPRLALGALFALASACHSGDDTAAPDGSADAPAIDAPLAPDASPDGSVCVQHGNVCSDSNTSQYECAAPSDDPGCPSSPLPSPVRGFCCVPNDCVRAGGRCGDVEAGVFGSPFWCNAGTAPSALSCGAEIANPLCCAPNDGGLLTCGGGLDTYCASNAPAVPCERQLSATPYAARCDAFHHVMRSQPCGGVILVRLSPGTFEGDHFYYDESTGALLAVGNYDNYFRFECYAGVNGFRIPDACILQQDGAPGPGEVDTCAPIDGGVD